MEMITAEGFNYIGGRLIPEGKWVMCSTNEEYEYTFLSLQNEETKTLGAFLYRKKGQAPSHIQWISQDGIEEFAGPTEEEKQSHKCFFLGFNRVISDFNQKTTEIKKGNAIAWAPEINKFVFWDNLTIVKTAKAKDVPGTLRFSSFT